MNFPPGKYASSIIFMFHDPDGSGLELMQHRPPSLFGVFASSVKLFQSCPLFSQCSCCHRLGHGTDRCRCPSTLIVCPLCGGPHTQVEHAHRCPVAATKHHSKSCDCTVSCFICRERRLSGEGHSTLSPLCPLKKLYRLPTDPSLHAAKKMAMDPPLIPSNAETVPLLRPQQA